MAKPRPFFPDEVRAARENEAALMREGANAFFLGWPISWCPDFVNENHAWAWRQGWRNACDASPWEVEACTAPGVRKVVTITRRAVSPDDALRIAVEYCGRLLAPTVKRGGRVWRKRGGTWFDQSNNPWQVVT